MSARAVHTVSVYVERGDAEVTLPCRVSLYGFHEAAEHELEWLDGEPTDGELASAEESARSAFTDWLVEQPTEQDYADEAADRAYDEERDWQMLVGAAS